MAAHIEVLCPGPAAMGLGPDQASGWKIDPDSRPEVRALSFLRTSVLLMVARLALVVLGFQRTAKIMDRFTRGTRRRAGVDQGYVASSAYTVSLAAAFLPFRILCLERSLVLYHWFKRDGVPATLRLGVRARPFEAHAWVVLQGSPVHDDADRLRDFDPIFELS
jgi:hypothetical protein